MNENQPLISVIVPVYNCEMYLNQCVESIINQTYSNLEIVLVDDGSTDDSGKICDEYSEKDHRVVVLHTVNGGAASARNKGLNVAKGEYITFVDSDDWIESDMYHSMLELLKNNSADVAKVGFIKEYENNSSIVLGNEYDGIYLKDEAVKKFLYHENEFCGGVWDKLYKKELFDKVRFPENYITEDYYVNALIFCKLNSIAVSSKAYYHYRMQNDSVCHQPVNSHTFDEIETAKKLIEFYKENDVAKKIDYEFYLAYSYYDVLYNLVIKDADKNTVKKYQKVFIKIFHKCLFNFKVSNFKKIRMLLFGLNPKGYETLKLYLKKVF